MPNENVRVWSTTAASNASADGAINWAEGQSPASVNDSARSMMAAFAKWLKDNGANLTTGGTGTAYTLTSNTGYASLDDGMTLVVKVNTANTGAATLNLDSLGAKSLRKFTSGAEGALSASDMVTGNHYFLIYDSSLNSAAGGWIVLNPSTVGSTSISANSISNTLLAQMPTVTVKSNLTGGTANAADNTVSAVLDSIGSTQGTILYRGASSWNALTPGTTGQFLKTNGAGANPAWASAGGSGTVTSIATTGPYLTGGPITTTGTLALGTMSATARLLGSSSSTSTITDISTGTGISLSGTTLSNSGVTSLVAGNGITVSGATGAVTVTGKVAQVVSTITGTVATGTTIIPFDNTIPQNTEGDQYMTLAITPKNASSTLYIDVCFIAANSVTGAIVAALFQDATANSLAVSSMNSNAAGGVFTIRFQHVMTAGTTSATTFKVRAGPVSAATLTFNGSAGSGAFGGTFASSIVITEILP